MSTIRQDHNLPDEDSTEELPVLSESARGGESDDIPELLEAVDEPTGDYDTSLLRSRPELDDRGALAPAANAATTAKIEELERDIVRLTAGWTAVEQRLAAKDAELVRLDAELAAAATALERERQERAATVAERERELEAARAEHAAATAELAALRASHAVQDVELARLRDALEQSAAEPPAAADPAPSDDSAAALAAYIENRRAHWEETEALAASRQSRIGELERELEQRVTRQWAAEARMREELARADELRAELVAVGRTLATRERELAAAVHDTAEPALGAELAAERAKTTALAAELAAAREELVTAHAAVAHDEQVTRLESELEQALAETVELQAAAAALTADLEAVRAELGRHHAELERTRSETARLERALAEKDRALEARNLRLATLEQELEQKMAALQRLNALDVSLQSLDARISQRLAQPEAVKVTPAGTPVLVCLTTDQPHRYPLDKSVMTIGRGSQCDIQVLTHFISREHARLFVNQDGVVIEDLGSTNGVFVNAVRIARQLLQHSDLVTVGETQFRFLEATAH